MIVLKPAQSHLKRWLFCCSVVSLLLLQGCAEDISPRQLSGHTMGTSWHVTYIPGPDSSQGDVADVQQAIEQQLADVNASMSTYRSDSEISTFNNIAPMQWFDVSAGFMQVLQSALQIGDASGGAYDVTIGPVVDLWGFGPRSGDNAVPDSLELQTVLQQVGQGKLQLDKTKSAVRKTSRLALDFSSIAKGYGVDQVANWFVSRGVKDFLVEVGGEMRLSGKNPRGELWHIAIEQPDSMIGTVARAISLSNTSVATSGDYRNYFEVDGRRYSHTIDPRTGYPIQHSLVSVTVVHPSSMLADAWATAFMVLGVDASMKVAQEHGLAVYLIQRTGQSYSSSYSPLFKRYLDDVQTQFTE